MWLLFRCPEEEMKQQGEQELAELQEWLVALTGAEH